MMTNNFSLAASAAGVFSMFFVLLMLGLVPGSVAAAPMAGQYISQHTIGFFSYATERPLAASSGEVALEAQAAIVPQPVLEPVVESASHVPALARHLTIQGCLEFSNILIPGAFVIWCRPCEQICIVIFQPGVDDRSVFSVPDAPLDSPMRNFSASDYSVHRSRAGVGIRVAGAKPIAE